ncbi:MAG: DTW domain-containing protein [Polyangiaceae bacterium]|nr:DTW domain-containing protein [Polyangiaceae bacterium]
MTGDGRQPGARNATLPIPEGLEYTRDGVRTRRIPRCEGCWLHTHLCVCGDLPRLTVKTRVVIVMHHVELRRSSNTGRIAARILGADIHLRGLQTGSDAPPLESNVQGGRRLVLFPAENARLLTAADADENLTLVVPDGNWKQASRALHRDPAARGAEVVTLPPGLPSRYRLRKRTNSSALSTFEAIVRALSIVEGPWVEEPMMRAFDLFVERTLFVRGGVAADGYD